MENSKINIEYFICESLANNPKAYKYIDKIYDENKDMYLEYMNEIKKGSIDYDGSIVQEYYFKKMYSIICTRDVDKEMYILKMTYKKSAQFVKNCDIINLFSFLKSIKNKEDWSDDELNGSLLATIVIAKHENKKVNESDPVFIDFMNILTLRTRMIVNEHHFSYSNLSKEQKKRARDIQLSFMNKYRIDYTWLPVAAIDEDMYMNPDMMTEMEARTHFISSIFDMEHISITSLVGNKFFKDKDIQELINCYLASQEFLGKRTDTIDYEDLYSFLVPSIYLRYMIRAYKECKNYFFKNITDEDTVALLSKKEEELNEIKQENFVLKGEKAKLKNKYKEEIDNLIEENRVLNNSKKKLQQELNSYPIITEELNQLRNLMFNLNQDNIINENKTEEIDIDYINSINAICFGGNDNWVNSMKKVLPNWTFIPVGIENFDVALLQGKDYIFINTIANSHGAYYRIIENKDVSTKIRYINSLNKDRVLYEINNSIKQ